MIDDLIRELERLFIHQMTPTDVARYRVREWIYQDLRSYGFVRAWTLARDNQRDAQIQASNEHNALERRAELALLESAWQEFLLLFRRIHDHRMWSQ